MKVSSRCDPDAPQNGLCGKKGEGASSVRSCKCGQDCLLKAHCAYLSLPMTRSLSLGTVALLCWRFRSEKSNSTTKKKKKKLFLLQPQSCAAADSAAPLCHVFTLMPQLCKTMKSSCSFSVSSAVLFSHVELTVLTLCLFFFFFFF